MDVVLVEVLGGGGLVGARGQTSQALLVDIEA